MSELAKCIEALTLLAAKKDGEVAGKNQTGKVGATVPNQSSIKTSKEDDQGQTGEPEGVVEPCVVCSVSTKVNLFVTSTSTF